MKMEFIDKHQNPTEKCMICLNPAWIKIAIIDNQERMEHFICVTHYIEYLEKYIEGTLDDSVILFDKESGMLEIPLYEAIDRFGGINEPELLDHYIIYLNEKVASINKDMRESSDQFFISLLRNEKQDKELRILLAKSRIKYFNT